MQTASPLWCHLSRRVSLVLPSLAQGFHRPTSGGPLTASIIVGLCTRTITIRASSGGWPTYQLSGFAMVFHFRFSKSPVFRWVCAKSEDTSHNTPYLEAAGSLECVGITNKVDGHRVLRCIWLKALFEANSCCMLVAGPIYA